MASNLPDASLPSEANEIASRYDVLQLQLPLTSVQIQEQVRLLQEHLTVASEVLTSRGVTLLDLKVTITYPTPDQNSATFLQPRAFPTATSIDIPAETDERFDTMTNTPAPPLPDDEIEGQATETPLVDPITAAEADSEVDEDEDAPPANPAVTPRGTQCKICMDELAPEAVVRINCGCAYCGTCLNDHIMHGLSSRANYPAKCCAPEGIDIGDASPYLNFEVILRWSEVEAEYKERLPMYCQNKECSAHIPANRLVGENKFVDCNSCHTDNCKECRQWRFGHGGDDLDVCPEDIVSKEDRELANSEKWKQCPGCKNLVERLDGCNNMQCECNTEFCYDCGVEYSPDHRCGCETSPDQDGWHHREGEMPADLADEDIDMDDYIDMLGGLLVRVDQNGHGHFADGDAAALWLRDHAENDIISWDGLDAGETVVWDDLDGDEEAQVFQVYERILRGGW